MRRPAKPRVANARHHSTGRGSKHHPCPRSGTQARERPPVPHLPIDRGGTAIASLRDRRSPDPAERGADPPKDGRTAREIPAQATSRCRRYPYRECSRRGQNPDEPRVAADSPILFQPALRNRACSSLMRAPCQRKAAEASKPRSRAAVSTACDDCFAKAHSIS